MDNMIDLARAKSEALVNILISLSKQTTRQRERQKKVYLAKNDFARLLIWIQFFRSQIEFARPHVSDTYPDSL